MCLNSLKAQPGQGAAQSIPKIKVSNSAKLVFCLQYGWQSPASQQFGFQDFQL